MSGQKNENRINSGRGKKSGLEIYSNLEPVCPLFLWFNPPKPGPNSNQNKGHLGSRNEIKQDRNKKEIRNNSCLFFVKAVLFPCFSTGDGGGLWFWIFHDILIFVRVC